MIKFGVSQCFQPVGNGTFKTGSIFDSRRGNFFNWVYDCGSTRSLTLNRILENITAQSGWPNYIDMLVISHFDNDHVNGVETLLRHCRVKSLVLPFSEWTQSVREISVLGKKGTSPSAALLQLNPLQWLASRNFDVHVDEVILVQGESDLPSVGSEEENPKPRPNDFPQNDDSRVFSGSYFTFNHPSWPGNIKIKTIRHYCPIQALNSDFEFVFFNAEKDFTELGLIIKRNGQWYAKKSGKLLSDVKADIQNTIISINLHNPLSTMPANWRKILKNCYEKHFGHTGKAKNNISLCMYAAPVQMEISEFWVGSNQNLYPTTFSPTSRLATLCTGDIHLTPNVISDLRNHLGPMRWDKIGLIQVPHHGSQHSWTVGNAALLAPAQFLYCASGTKHHPHPVVKKDLSGSIAHTADCTDAVFINYIV
ncbi:hypothetical protein [Serratia oryzae]|uniref:Metallo-beta-lactamase domain-containing protein n=1 Tax=Serratia oryzae TaxID=2034155 RepID=A0A1S8CDA2_9GAMM|nr:hypothetical protein [Serratia oryzae]OMQ17577.1 hypothetical protein BMI79_22090 [Serratia oryzae]